MTNARLFAAVELVWLAFLFWLAVWGPAWGGVRAWHIAASLLFFATIVVSLIWRRPGWKESGFRLDNVLPALQYTGLAAAAVLLLLWLAAGVLPPAPWTAPGRLLQSVAFGMVQQALMLGYCFHRWQTLVKNSAAAAVANSLCFALLHLPDLAFAGVVFAGEMLLTGLFLRARNVLVTGMAHGVAALALVPFLLDANVMKISRIGPPGLSAIGAAIDAASPRAAAIAICSKVIAPNQFGGVPEKSIERILRGRTGADEIRPALLFFLGQDHTALCVITEREFYRYLAPAERQALWIIAERFIWRNAANTPALFAPDPFLGIFRDRVLLVANRPFR